ncbi:MAG TPA: T9SS type A sorting domain-containing protein [Bacteroidia bacterium]|jgi:hypothetical protein|nr:T9SS type A sorting domain-containing protein [Bacteroidia bacterium]
MKKLFFITLTLISASLVAQTAAKWENVYGGPGIENGYDVKCYFNRGYVAVGSSGSLGVSDGYLVRTDTIGITMWEKFYGGNNVDVIRSIHVLPDSGFIMAGYSNSAGNGGYDGWLIRADKNGDTLWTKYIGTSNWDFFYSVYPTWDGGFVIAGGTYGQGMGDEDMYFVKTNSSGDTLWTKTYGGTRTDEARGIIQTGDSLLAACGFSDDLGDTLGDSWMLRMDQNGDTLFTRTYGNTTAMDKAYGIACVNSYGWLLTVGETTISGDPSAYLWYMSMTGNTFLTQTYGPAGEDFFSCIVGSDAGHYGMAGLTSGLGAGNGDFLFNSDLSITTFGSLQSDIAYGIDTGYAGGYIISGTSESFDLGNQQMFLVKTDTDGYSTNVLGIHELITATSSQQAGVYPVPANDQLILSIPSSGNSSANEIQICDISGRVIHDEQNVGSTFTDGTELFSIATVTMVDGIYFARISTTESGTYTAKFIIQHH